MAVESGEFHTSRRIKQRIATLLVCLSSCTHGGQKLSEPSAAKVVVPNSVNAKPDADLPRLDLNLVAPAKDDQSAILWPSMPASDTRSAICRVTLGARSGDGSVKCTTVVGLHTVVDVSPTGRWFAAAIADELWVFDATSMAVVHRATVDAQDVLSFVPARFRADDTAIAYLDGRGQLIVVDLAIDKTQRIPVSHPMARTIAAAFLASRGIRWIGNDRLLTFASGIAPQIHTMESDSNNVSVSLASPDTDWMGIDARILPDEKRLIIADRAGFVGEFDSISGKQLITYRARGTSVQTHAIVQLTNAGRFLVTQRSERHLSLAVFVANTPNPLWKRDVPGGFQAELSNDGHRVGYAAEIITFQDGLDWHSTIVDLEHSTEQRSAGVFLTWAKDAWFTHESATTLRNPGGVVFERDQSWAPWAEPERGSNTVWFGGGAHILRIRDGEKIPLEFDIAGSAEDPTLRLKVDPR